WIGMDDRRILDVDSGAEGDAFGVTSQDGAVVDGTRGSDEHVTDHGGRIRNPCLDVNPWGLSVDGYQRYTHSRAFRLVKILRVVPTCFGCQIVAAVGSARRSLLRAAFTPSDLYVAHARHEGCWWCTRTGDNSS